MPTDPTDPTTLPASLTRELADEVFGVLKETCATTEFWREDFVRDQSTDYCTEWRFSGSLGFGGKFRRSNYPTPRLYVDCYPEDMTPARQAAIDAANATLTTLAERMARR